MEDRERIVELYKEILLFMPITCETCYLHKPGTYTREDCITYGKRLCKLDKVNIDKLAEVLEQVGYTRQPELKVLEWAKDHYWDSLEPQRDLIIKHLESCQKTVKEN